MMRERKMQTKHGWFFAAIGGDYYVWMLAIGKFCVSWEKK